MVRQAEAVTAAGQIDAAVLTAGYENEIDAAFATLFQQRVGGSLVDADPSFTMRREEFVALAARHTPPHYVTRPCLCRSWRLDELRD